ncbi:MAG TPA: hypothetical protein VFR67_26895, partial [Pilimelia sp.]|nr:hypothetical protein [Pilimelia sp.]
MIDEKGREDGRCARAGIDGRHRDALDRQPDCLTVDVERPMSSSSRLRAALVGAVAIITLVTTAPQATAEPVEAAAGLVRVDQV